MVMPSSTLAEGARPRGSALDPSGSRRRRPLAWLALAFLAGIVLDEWQRPALSTLGGWCVGTALTAILLLVSGPRRGRLLLGAGLLAALAGGALRHAQTTRHLPAHDVTRRTGEAPGLAWLEGTILERERTGPDRARLRWTVELHALGASPDTLAPASGRVQLALNLDEAGAAAEPCEGERVRVLARLEAPHGGTLPGTYDAARRLARQGIRRVGEPAADTLVRVAHASWLRPGLRMRRIGGALAERNEGWLDADRAGLLNALVLGRRAGLAYEDREAFQRAGAAHLLAISGLHVHALALVLFFALGRLGIGRRGAMLGVMLAGAGYAFLAGAPASAVRAALMIGVFGVGLLARRAADPLTSLAVAALGILFIAPDELFTAGFQLSFLAVLALVTLYPTFESAWLRWRNVPEPWVKDPDEARKTAIARGLRRYVFISLATWIGTAPAVAWHLGGFNLLAVFANLVAVPLAGLAFVGGLLATLAGGGALSALLAVPLTILLGFNRFVGELPAASVEVPAPAGWACAAYAGLLGWAWLERGRRLTLPQAAWILPLCAAAILAGGLFRDRPERPRVTIYDLAFGRAALVETPGGEAALVDAGGEGDGRKLAEGLRRQGLRALALLVCTEDDPDALGGARELLARMPVRRAILPRSAAPSAELRGLEAELARRGVPYGPADPGAALQGPGDVRWDFASDAADKLPARGSEALAVRVGVPGARILFALARSEASLTRLLDSGGARLEADVARLWPGPGGRWPAATEDLLARSGARVLVAGRGAWEDDPGEDAQRLEALAQRRGLRLLRPARDGSLRVGDEALAGWAAYREGRWEPVVFP